MRLTPLDIQKHHFSVRWRGFDPAEVEAFVRLVAEDYESLMRERDVLRHRVRELEERVDELQTQEKTLQETLVTAQALSEDLKRTAVKEAEVVVSRAEVQGERILDSAQKRAADLREDIRAMRQLRSRLAATLRSTIEHHLALLDGLATDPEREDEPTAAGPSEWARAAGTPLEDPGAA